MDTELIAQTWESLGPGKEAFVDAFYQRFFQKYPHYRPLFPRTLNPQHLDKMTETMALVARLAEDGRFIAPHLHKVGAAHERYHLKPEDLANFRDIFVEMLGEHCAEWSQPAAASWKEAFDQTLIPMMMEGMR